MAERPPATPQQEILAGFFSGVADAIASHPLDQVKTQFQINNGKNGAVLASLQRQAAAGGILQLYRGVLAACLRPQSLCMYTGNEWSKRIVGGPSGELSTAGGFIAGGLTGYFEAACVTPFELVKVRMQSLDHLGRYHSSFQCAWDVVQREGFPVLYNGFWASCWRNCTFNGAFFGLLHWAKTSLPLPRPSSTLEAAGLDIGLGMAASFAATIVKMPFDVAKNRLQNELTPPPGQQPRYRHTLQCCAVVWREEGGAALWKGFSPTAMRIVLGQSVAYAAFEFAMNKLTSSS